MPWMTQGAVEDVVHWRRQQPITSPEQFGALAGIRVAAGPSRFLTFPADNLVITLSAKSAPLERRFAVRLTPQSRDRPWTIDYDVEVPRAARDGGETNSNALPLPPLLLPVP